MVNVKNEIMFETDELINIMFKLFFLSNCQANLKVDGGIGNRYRPPRCTWPFAAAAR